MDVSVVHFAVCLLVFRWGGVGRFSFSLSGVIWFRFFNLFCSLCFLIYLFIFVSFLFVCSFVCLFVLFFYFFIC